MKKLVGNLSLIFESFEGIGTFKMLGVFGFAILVLTYLILSVHFVLFC